MAAIKYFIHGKGTEKGLRWEERKDGGGGGEDGRKVGSEGMRALMFMLVRIYGTHTQGRGETDQ